MLERPAFAQTVIGGINSTASLNAAITQVDAGAAGQSFVLNLAKGFTIGDGMGTQLLAFNTKSNVTLNGNMTTLDGGGTQRGLFVFSGNVTINDLTIQNALAKGGAGGGGTDGGGGGGAGLGGALFVASGAQVTVNNVSLNQNNATGGSGGAIIAGTSGANGGGGGGLVGTGGSGSGIIVRRLASINAPPGNGGFGGGGGGAGNKGGAGGSSVNGLPSAGGQGGTGAFGAPGGTGGFGGGGGGGGFTVVGVQGGAGGFGGGGGGGAAGGFRGGIGGFGGGNGNSGVAGGKAGAGGGGLGAGGALFVQQGGTLTITGNFAVNGNSVTGGTGGANAMSGSAFGSGIFIQGTNTLTFSPSAGSTQTISDVIADEAGSVAGATGVGGLTVNGTGTLVLAGANTYTGATTVTAGTLAVTGSIANSDVTVTGGTFGGSGRAKTLAVMSGGTVAPGVVAPFSTLNVTGNASFASGSTFLVNVNAAGQNDKLAVGGATTLNGGTVSVMGGTGLNAATNFTILTAQSVTGKFANVTSNLAFLTPTLTTNATNVVLTLMPIQVNTPVAPATPITFASVATTPNQIATANAVQALGSGPIFNAVIGQSVAGAQQAFDALSGEVHASVVNAAFTDATLPQNAILDRLNQPVAPPVLGATVETTGAYAADLPSRNGPALAPVSASFYQPRMFEVWGEGFGDWGRVSSDHNAASLSRTTGGFVLGGDASARGVIGGDWRFGFAGGYTNDSISVNQRGSSGTFESIFGGAYAGASFGSLQLRAGALYGTNTTSTTRQVAFPGFSEALSSNNGGFTAQGFGELGYRIQLAGIGLGVGSRAYVEPFAGAAAILIHQNGFTEAGGTSALTASARDFNVQTTTLGVRGELAFASMPLTLKTMLGWRHAYGNVVPSVLLALQGGTQTFNISGVPIDRDAFVAEAGLDYALTSMLSVGVSYSGQYGQRAIDNAVKGHLEWQF